jgi:hypothetical protein
LPLDVSNARGYGGGFNMELIWQIVYATIIITIIILIPFAIFLYESDEDKSFVINKKLYLKLWQGGRIAWAFMMTLGLIIIVGLIIFISFAFFN